MEKLNNIPEFLKIKLVNQYGNEIFEKINNGYGFKRKVTLRVNTLKSNNSEIEKVLDENNILYSKVAWYDSAYVIENANEDDLRRLPIYDEGKIYLQSLSSMLPVLVLEPEERKDILDMAAAPGGKTTQMAAFTNNKSYITACELNTIRAERLKYNVDKQGATCVSVLKKDSRTLDDFLSFDNILLDAPCSGSGTIDLNNENTYNNFTEKLVDKSSNSQRKLLTKAIKLLKKGQTMIYSTCSILEEENEQILNFVLSQGNVELVPIDFSKYEDIPLLPSKYEGVINVCPTELFEGFFVAKLRKK